MEAWFSFLLMYPYQAWASSPAEKSEGGAAAGGSWSPKCHSGWVAVSPHTEISYVVPPTPDTFLTSV